MLYSDNKFVCGSNDRLSSQIRTVTPLRDESSMVNTEGFFFLFHFFFSRLFFSPVWFGPFVLPVLFPGARFLLKASSHMCRRIRNRLHYAAAHCKCKESEIVSPCGSSVIRLASAGCARCTMQWIVEKQQVWSAGHGGGNWTVDVIESVWWMHFGVLLAYFES